MVFAFLGIGAWNALGSLHGLIVNLVISFFLSLALEPLVLWLVRHNVKRSLAAITSLLGSIVAVVALFAMFGNLFINQFIQLIQTIPDLYNQVTDWITSRWDVEIPRPQTSSMRPWRTGAATSPVARGALEHRCSVSSLPP